MERIAWIDSIRGILLLLICLSHFGSNLSIIQYIIYPTANYWVPLFFLLSGFLFKTPQKTFKVYLFKKIRTLLIPYLGFSILFLILDWNSYLQPSNIFQNLYKIFVLGTGANKASPLWFVMVLFISSICIYSVINYVKNLKLILVATIIFSLIALCMSEYDIELPLLLHLLPSAVTYMLIGFYIRRILTYQLLQRKGLKLILLFFSLLGGVIGIFFVKLGDFHFNEIKYYPLFYLSPILFGLFVILSFQNVENKIRQDSLITKILLWVSRNGIVVLSCHAYLIICSGIIIRFLHISDEIIKLIITTIIVVGGLVILVPLFNKYFPWLIGRNTKFDIKTYDYSKDK